MDGGTNRQLARGHAFSGIITQDHARVHMGDVHSYASTHNYICHLYSSPNQLLSPSRPFLSADETAESGMASKKRKRASNEDEHRKAANKEESLEQVFSKLVKLSKSIQDQRIGKDARKILRRIALAINAVKPQQAGLPEHSIVESLTRMDHDKSDFKNIRKNLKNAERIDVNTDLQRMRYAKPARVVRKYSRIAFEQWEVSLKTVTIESRNSDGTEVTDSLITLYLGPRSRGSGLPVAVHFRQTKTHTGVSFINPVILAYRVVPKDAEVFKVVESDDLMGLRELLADGKATLRDCDHEGTTLLHVSECSKDYAQPS